MRKKYTITGLDCAHCAAKLEEKMNKLPEVESVILSFTTEQLIVEADDQKKALTALCALAQREEPDAEIVPLRRNAARHEHHHEHTHEHGHDHEHDHEHHHEHHHHHEEECCCDHDHHHHDGEHDHEHDHEHHHHEDEHEHHHHDEQKEGEWEKDQEEKPWWKSREGVTLETGIVLFVAGLLLLHAFSLTLVGYIVLFAAYLDLGWEVIRTAVKNLSRGKVFDENFLMSIATIGALCMGEFSEAVGVMLFDRIGELFEQVAVTRSRKQIMEAADLRPERVRLYEDGTVTQVPPEDVDIGQWIEVRPGDRIALDGTVMRGESRIDTSAVTGEAVPVAVAPGSEVFSGCVNTTGAIYLRVDKLLEDSMCSRILEAVENAAASKPKMDRFITRFARVYTPFVILFAVCVAVIPSLVTGNWQQWIYTALTFLIISCPCALVLSVPLAFFAGIGAGSKRGILFKGGASLEALAKIRAVVLDKTGTITEGTFTVKEVLPAEGFTGEELLKLAAGAENLSTHPVASSIRQAAEERGIAADKSGQIEEISGEGVKLTRDSATILCGNQKLLAKNGVEIAADGAADAGTEVFVAKDGRYAGRIVINDKIKKDSKEAIQKMNRLGLYTAMLTGDTQENARAVQKETKIQEVYARQLPEDKLANLQKIREEKGAVLFVGDGINDAPVLAGADVGAAMGSGADAAIEAADVVFMTSRLSALSESYAIAKCTKRIANQNVVFALAVKIAVMVLGLFGIASMWMAVFADSGVAMLCVCNSIRVLYRKKF